MRRALPAALVLLAALLAGCTEDPETCDLFLAATALADGSIHLDWDSMPGATTYRIARSEGGGPEDTIYAFTSEPDTEFTDTATNPGTSYAYRVIGHDAEGEAVDCAAAEVVAVPELAGPLALALAAGGGVVAFAALRRRRS